MLNKQCDKNLSFNIGINKRNQFKRCSKYTCIQKCFKKNVPNTLILPHSKKVVPNTQVFGTNTEVLEIVLNTYTHLALVIPIVPNT